MSNEALVALIAGGTAVVSGGIAGWIGFLGAKSQVRGEMEKLRLENQETQRRARADLYALLLKGMLRLATERNTMSQETFEAMVADVGPLIAAVRVSGEAKVAGEADAVFTAITELGHALINYEGPRSFTDRYVEAMREGQPGTEIDEAFEQMLDAMREDVGAPGGIEDNG